MPRFARGAAHARNLAHLALVVGGAPTSRPTNRRTQLREIRELETESCRLNEELVRASAEGREAAAKLRTDIVEQLAVCEGWLRASSPAQCPPPVRPVPPNPGEAYLSLHSWPASESHRGNHHGVTSGSHGGAATSIGAAPIMRRAGKHVMTFIILSR